MKRNHYFPVILLILAGCAGITTQRQYEQARQMESESPADALERYESLLPEAPDSDARAEIHYRMGILHNELGDLSAALENWIQAGDASPGSRWDGLARYELINHDSNLDDGSRRAALMDLLSRFSDPEIAGRINFTLGNLYFQEEEWMPALKAFRNAVSYRIDPERSHIYWYKIGICESRLGLWAESERDLSRSLSAQPDYEPVYLALNDLYLETGRRNKAYEVLLDGMQRFGAGAVENAFKELLSDEFSEAELADIDTLSRAKDSYVHVQMELGRREIHRGDLDNALARFESIQTRDHQLSREIDQTIYDLRQRMDVGSYRIAVLAPFSGPLAPVGHSIYQGVALRIEQMRAIEPEFDIELIIRDSRGKPDAAIAEVRQLAEEEKVLAVIGPLRSDTTEAIEPVAAEWHLPVITPGCPNEAIAAASPWIFRMFPSPERESYELLRFIFEQSPHTVFGIVYPDIEYAEQALAGYHRAMRDYHGESVFEIKYKPGLTTFHHLFSQFKDTDAQVILIPDQADRAGQIAGQLRYQEIFDALLVGLGGWEDPLIAEIAGPHLNESIFVSEYPRLTEPRASMIRAFRMRFGDEPDALAVRAYECASLIMQAYSSGVKYREQLRYFLQNNPAGIPGGQFDPDGNFQPAVMMYAVESGKIIPRRIMNGKAWVDYSPPLVGPVGEPDGASPDSGVGESPEGVGSEFEGDSES